MIYKIINLNDKFPLKYPGVTLKAYCLDNSDSFPGDKKRRTILVLPGGGYSFVSDREGEPIALKFLALNFNVFVLNYCISDYGFPYPIIEGFAAIAYIRQHAEQYNVDTDNISVLGFSAGGHFAATLACYQNEEIYSKYLNVKQEDLRIDACVLCYPVIQTIGEYVHQGSANCLTKLDASLYDYYSIDRHVKANFPRTFIWTTKEDSVVDYRNSTLMKEKLDNAGVECELHLFEHGEHGGATCDEITCAPTEIKRYKEASKWIELCANFLKK